MPKIIKNGKEYSGVPIEVVTAWAPTADPVQVKEPLMGNTDISSIGDGTVTGAISAVKSGLNNLPVNFLGGVSALPNITKDGLFGFSTTANITVSGTTLPAGTRCFGVFYYGIGHCIGIANGAAVYTLRLAGGEWSLLATK